MVFHIYQDIRNEWRWYLAAANGKKLATSAQAYARRSDCAQAIKHMREAVAAPMISDNFGLLSNITGAALAV